MRGPDTARALLPPGRGRGSSVSAIVCYLTGLSHVDPIENELLLGRFLNEEITALPDIDLDFPRDIREVLLPRVHERYGRERSALVAAFPTYRSRGAIRELGKALGLPPGRSKESREGRRGWRRTSRATSPPPTDRGKRRGGALGLALWLAAEAMGLPRHLSQHPGGMVVATQPLIDCCPVVPAAMAGRQMIQWDKDSSGDAGFLKIDLLGLGMLSAVERCVEEIARTRNERIDLSRIPYDDPATYAAIQEADTVGVFQIESRAQMASLRRTRPANLDDLTIQVAIVRPGPIQGGAVNPYIARLQRLRVDPGFQVPYDHPSLESVLEDTLGTIIFQDQVIEVAMAFAGFGAGEAEGLRRVMSKRRSDAAMEEYHRRFVAGAQDKHADVETALAERVWDMVKGFSGFGFPKAHGAAFGLLAYQSTWLRVHYGPEFLAALLNEQPMGFYPPDSLAHEAKRRGLAMLPVDVNRSRVDCYVEDGAVRLGLRYVTGLRREDADAVAAHARPYASPGDFAARSGLGRPGLAALAWAGAVDALAGDRRAALWQLGVAAPGERMDGGTQLALPLDLPAAPRAARAQRLGVAAGRLRDHRRDPGRPRARAPAALAARRRGHERRPAAPAPRPPGDPGRPGHRPPAPLHGQGRRVPAHRGRARHRQRDRAPAGLRARPPRRSRRAAGAVRGDPREAARGRRPDQPARRAHHRAASGRRGRRRGARAARGARGRRR